MPLFRRCPRGLLFNLRHTRRNGDPDGVDRGWTTASLYTSDGPRSSPTTRSRDGRTHAASINHRPPGALRPCHHLPLLVRKRVVLHRTTFQRELSLRRQTLAGNSPMLPSIRTQAWVGVTIFLQHERTLKVSTQVSCRRSGAFASSSCCSSQRQRSTASSASSSSARSRLWIQTKSHRRLPLSLHHPKPT